MSILFDIYEKTKAHRINSDGAARIRGDIRYDSYNIVNTYESEVELILRKLPILSDGTTYLFITVTTSNGSLGIEARGLKENSVLVIPYKTRTVNISFGWLLFENYISTNFVFDIVFGTRVKPTIYTYDNFEIHFNNSRLLSMKLLMPKADSATAYAFREVAGMGPYGYTDHLLVPEKITTTAIGAYGASYAGFRIQGSEGKYILWFEPTSSYQIVTNNLVYIDWSDLVALKFLAFDNSIVKYTVVKNLNAGDRVDIIVYDHFARPENAHVLNKFSFTASTSGTIRKTFVDYVAGARRLYVQAYVNDELDFTGLVIGVSKI